MISLANLALMAGIVCVAVYTASFGVWTWKRHNRLGAVMIFMAAAAVVILPAFTLFFKEA